MGTLYNKDGKDANNSMGHVEVDAVNAQWAMYMPKRVIDMLKRVRACVLLSPVFL